MCIGIRAEFVVYASNTVVIITDFRKFISSKQLERTTYFFLQKVVASLVYIISGYCPVHSLGTAVRTQLADTLAAGW